MATISNRKGRWTAQVRLRHLNTRAKTFDTHEEAKEWADSVEKEMREWLEIERSTGQGNAHLDSDGLKTLFDVISLPRIKVGSSSCGIYFLFQGENCVYIGQSRYVHARVNEHKRMTGKWAKAFDSYAWVPCEPDRLLAEETRLIRKLKPILNLQIKRRVPRKSHGEGYTTQTPL